MVGLTIATTWQIIAMAPVPASPDRSTRVIRKWTLPGTPRGLAVDSLGFVYVGLSDRQSIVKLNPSNDTIEAEVILDSPEIASTKDLSVVRIDTSRTGQRLLTANGTDESATILSLPGLGILREITLEGEIVRDIHADPRGRYLFVLGRNLHVFDANGDEELREISEPRPMAVAVSSDGSMLAVAGSEKIAGGEFTTLGLWSTFPLEELQRIPLQTDAEIISLTFAAADSSIIAASSEQILQLTLGESSDLSMTITDRGMRANIRSSDLISTDRICLARESGPQSLTLGPSGAEVLFAEKRCGSGGSVTGGRRLVSIESLYGLEAYAVAWDKTREGVFATNSADKQILLYRYAPKGKRR